MRPKKMSMAVKDEKKMVVDVAAWAFNIVTSVGIIIVNKALMATYGFSFGKWWCLSWRFIFSIFFGMLSCWIYYLLHLLVLNGCRCMFCLCMFQWGSNFCFYYHGFEVWALWMKSYRNRWFQRYLIHLASKANLCIK